MTTARRYAALDGLRGIAALVVVMHHLLLVQPTLALPYLVDPPRVRGLAAALTYTPLHLLWGGQEAVVVFFVLSGFVLAVGAARGARTNWSAYYPRRLVRLYLPVAFAVALALPQALYLRPRRPGVGNSWWMDAHAGAGSLRGVANDLLLLRSPGATLTPLWSLKWEVWFSLLLPAYLLLLRPRRRAAALTLGIALLALSSVAGYAGPAWLVLPPVFGLGVLIAGQRDGLRTLAGRHGVALCTAGALLLVAPWTIHRYAGAGPAVDALCATLVRLGAILVVIAFLHGPVSTLTTGSGVVRWLGRRSFSLYLVHEPIVVSVGYALGGHPPLWLLVAIALPLSLLAAEMFGRLVEEPSHRLAQRAGRLAHRSEPPPVTALPAASPSVPAGAPASQPG